MAAHSVEAKIRSYLRDTKRQRDELGKLERGEYGYPPDVVDWHTHEVRKELRERWDEARAEITEIVESTREAYIASIPSHRQFRAALDNMERAAEIRRLAESASDRELVGLAERLAQKRDQAGAHGLRVALRERFDVADVASNEVAAKVTEHLDSIHATTHRNALASLVAAQHLRAIFDVGGPARDMSTAMADPVKSLAAAEDAQIVPVDDEGGIRFLSGEEFDEVLEHSGYDEIDLATA